MFEPGIDGCLN
jgi:hypothetical protein